MGLYTADLMGKGAWVGVGFQVLKPRKTDEEVLKWNGGSLRRKKGNENKVPKSGAVTGIDVSGPDFE